MKIFFSGMGGNGVSALAGFSAKKGYSVSGSDRLFDRHPDHPLARIFRAQAISIESQNGSGIDRSFDLAVFSTAVEKSNPDYRRAKELAIPVKTRPQFLADLISRYRTIAVAGTNGKSTVAGMLAFVMQRLGEEPNYVGGGRIKQLKTERNAGNYAVGKSDILIAEACESDGTIVEFLPTYSVILNLSLDHHTIEKTAPMFGELAAHTSDFVISGGDDKSLASCLKKKSIRFSIDTASEYQAKDITYHRFQTRFSVNSQEYALQLPGRHTVYNALACIACLRELGVPSDSIAASLAEFSGIERRFDIHLDNGRHLVVDDYAHNPQKILSLMQTMQHISRSVCYIFQPHGYGPVRLMKDGYIDTFIRNLRAPDHLILLPIYYAGGTVTRDVSSADIIEPVRAAGKSAEAISDRTSAFDRLGRWKSYAVLGARDDSLSEFAQEIAKRLE